MSGDVTGREDEGLAEFRDLGATIHRFRCSNPDCRHYEDDGYFTPRDNDAASAVYRSGLHRSGWLARVEREAAERAWDEGWDQGTDDAWHNGGHHSKPNPYREEAR